MANQNTITVENARVIFKNFKGEADTYNAKGNRNFAIMLDDPKILEKFEETGWNVKMTKDKLDDDGETIREAFPYLPVAVSFANVAPQVYLVTRNGKSLLTEKQIDMLDTAEIEAWDVIVTPYDWEVNGNTGRKAYLKKLVAVLVEDELDQKYADIPLSE